MKRGWYDPGSGEPFHVGQVYGRSALKAEAVQMIEDRLRARAGRIGLPDMIEVGPDAGAHSRFGRLRPSGPFA